MTGEVSPDGGGETSFEFELSTLEGLPALKLENLAVRWEKNEPIPAPHELKVAFTGSGDILTENVLGGRGDKEGNGVDDVEGVDCL